MSTSGIGKLFDWVRPHKKHIYYLNEGTAEEKNILGIKGANLCEMFRQGMPIPSAFVITADTCIEYFHQKDKDTKLSQQLISDYKKAIHEIENQTNKKFGGDFYISDPRVKGSSVTKLPLLLSVRSSAAVSMPGMMQTILNLGINDEITDSMARLSNNPRWAFDTYRRFLQMFGTVVMKVDKSEYEKILSIARSKRGVAHDSLLNMADLVEVVKEFKTLATIPNDPYEQLQMAIEAVFNSWYSPTAVKYRDIHNISDELGAAVTIQSMVYGNMNVRSGSGIAFTRNPSCGMKELYGEYLPNAEGEEVLCGARTPMTLSMMRTDQPVIFDQLMHIQNLVEKHFRDMQEIEFTVENGTLFILQSLTAKRTARAAVCIAVSMVKEKIITEREALLRIDPHQMEYFLHPMIDNTKVNLDNPQVSERIFLKGIAGSPGAAIGKVVFTCAQAIECSNKQEACILVKSETSYDDLDGLKAAVGVITSRGGISSHAAVTMRSMGKAAVTNLCDLNISWDTELVSSKSSSLSFSLGDIITIDGSAGIVYIGEMPTIASGRDENFQMIMQWADKYKRLQIYGTSETFEDVLQCHRIGGEGIGLLHTEYMFMKEECINLFRKMILSDNISERSECLLKLLPIHQAEYEAIFRCMNNRPVTIRLLDSPLEAFLPSHKSATYGHEISTLSNVLQISVDQCMHRVKELQEYNPMLGFRGCRLSIIYPEITEMQVKAIIGANIAMRQENIENITNILIPNVFSDHEVDIITPVINSACDSVCAVSGARYDMQYLDCHIGTAIETPRACIRADRIAATNHNAFVSIGTDLLTSLMFGFCKEDTHLFMSSYLNKHLIAKDPFYSLDIHGVGGMIQMAVRRSRRFNATNKIGIHGEHGGDPSSIHFFDRIGLDYITCHPYRIPIAKVAAAQAHIEETATQHYLAQDLNKRLMLGEMLI